MTHKDVWAQYATEIDYLLQRMEEPVREEFGQRLLTDSELFDRVAGAETELYDAEARGDLPAALRADFVRYLLATPAQQRRLAVARALLARSGRATPRAPRRVVAPWLLLAASLLAGAWLMQTWRPGGGGVGTTAVVLRLTPGGVRSAPATDGFPVLRMRRGVPSEIHLPWDGREAVRVEIARAGSNSPAWVGNAVTAAGQPPELVLRLADGVLQPGLYEVNIRSVQGELVGFAEFEAR